MSIEAIQQEISTWDAGKLRELEATIITLRHRRERPGYAGKMAQNIDDALAQRLGVASPEELSDSALRSLLAEAYRRERIGRHEVGQILGLDRWQTEQFLAEHDAQRTYTLDDLAFDRASLRRLNP